MAIDRFIYFEKQDLPTQEQLLAFLQGFFGKMATITWDENVLRHCITIEKEMSHYNSRRQAQYRIDGQDEQVIEIFRHIEIEESELTAIDVITRFSDPFVNTLAAGLVLHLCYAFKGKAESAETYPVPPFLR